MALPLFFQFSQPWLSWRPLLISVSPCSCWTQVSFLPFSEEHSHFLLLDQTLPMITVHPWSANLHPGTVQFRFHCPTPILPSCWLWMVQAAAGQETEISALLLSFLSHELSVTQQLLPRQSKELSVKIWKRQCCPVTELPFCLFLTHPHCSHSLHSSPLTPLSFDLN